MPRNGEQKFDVRAFLRTIGEGITSVDWSKGKTVFAQGDPADALFYIQSGKVKVTTVSAQGKEAVVAILDPGDFFGEGCMAGQPLRISSAKTLLDSTISRLDKAAVVRVLHTQPGFSELFMAHLLARNIRIEADLIDQLFNSSEKRLARLLLLLANFGKEGRPQPITTPVSQDTLADMIGTTRARVSFFMNRFRRLGFIEYNGNVQVHSSLLSVMLLDELHPSKGGAKSGSTDDSH
jgi:CRP/FNR family transcriptional regulator, cyclic AMP receptor protein